MAVYMQRLEAKGSKDIYLLSKWEEGRNEPDQVYTVVRGAGCSCPSPYRPCKHQAILETLLKAPEPTGWALDVDRNVYIMQVPQPNQLKEFHNGNSDSL